MFKFSLSESNLSQSQIDKIKGSARHGMLTKGDVLFAMGKVQDPRGTASKLKATKYGVEGAKLNEVRGRVFFFFSRLVILSHEGETDAHLIVSGIFSQHQRLHQLDLRNRNSSLMELLFED